MFHGKHVDYFLGMERRISSYQLAERLGISRRMVTKLAKESRIFPPGEPGRGRMNSPAVMYAPDAVILPSMVKRGGRGMDKGLRRVLLRLPSC